MSKQRFHIGKGVALAFIGLIVLTLNGCIETLEERARSEELSKLYAAWIRLEYEGAKETRIAIQDSARTFLAHYDKSKGRHQWAWGPKSAKIWADFQLTISQRTADETSAHDRYQVNLRNNPLPLNEGYGEYWFGVFHNEHKTAKGVRGYISKRTKELGGSTYYFL